MKQKPLPPLNWLRAFEVSARCLNFTHAAEELFLTQGAVSQQIRQLESHLGVALFKRLPRGLGLTEEGQAYLPVVQDAITRLAVGTNEIFGQHKRRPIKVRGSLAFFRPLAGAQIGGLSSGSPPCRYPLHQQHLGQGAGRRRRYGNSLGPWSMAWPVSRNA